MGDGDEGVWKWNCRDWMVGMKPIGPEKEVWLLL